MRTVHRSIALVFVSVLVVCTLAPRVGAQGASRPSAPPTDGKALGAPPASVATPEYVIGPEDVLTIALWHEQELSGDFTVRPDGRISLLLVNDIQAAGLTTEQLRLILTKAYAPFVDAPVAVSVKQINSRKVFISGLVPRPNAYLLTSRLTVAQLIAIAGGLLDYADRQNIIVLRAELGSNGQPQSVQVNYEDISRGRNLQQNIELKPGDTVIVR